MNERECYRAITLRFTLRNAVASTQTTYGYERKIHLDLAWLGDEQTWSVMPALSSGFMPIKIYKQFQSTVDYLISIISNVAEQQKGS